MSWIASVISRLAELVRYQATHHLELEVRELEAFFAYAVVGAFVGQKVVPAGISLKLLPYLSQEIEALVSRSSLGKDGLSFLASALDGL